MKDMVPGKAVEIGSDGNVYFALMSLPNRYMMDFLKIIGVKTEQGVIAEVSTAGWIKVRVNPGSTVRTAIIMQYDISKVIIVTEAPEDSR